MPPVKMLTEQYISCVTSFSTCTRRKSNNLSYGIIHLCHFELTCTVKTFSDEGLLSLIEFLSVFTLLPLLNRILCPLYSSILILSLLYVLCHFAKKCNYIRHFVTVSNLDDRQHRAKNEKNTYSLSLSLSFSAVE